MKIGIYGLGRFGAFWAGTLAKHFSVQGFSRHKPEVMPPGVNWVDEDEVLFSDVLIFCVSISALEPVLYRIKNRLKPGIVVMDTCSVKVEPVDLMKKILPPGVDILGTHPMFGPDSASRGIEGLPIVISPVRGEAGVTWRREFEAMGLRVLEFTPEEHDREAAYTQGITHFIGRVLGELKLQKSSIGTLGYTKLLEIIEQTCNDSWQLFHDLQNRNPYTWEMRKKTLNAFLKTAGELLKD